MEDSTTVIAKVNGTEDPQISTLRDAINFLETFALPGDRVEVILPVEEE